MLVAYRYPCTSCSYVESIYYVSIETYLSNICAHFYPSLWHHISKNHFPLTHPPRNLKLEISGSRDSMVTKHLCKRAANLKLK